MPAAFFRSFTDWCEQHEHSVMLHSIFRAMPLGDVGTSAAQASLRDHCIAMRDTLEPLVNEFRQKLDKLRAREFPPEGWRMDLGKARYAWDGKRMSFEHTKARLAWIETPAAAEVQRAFSQ
eukprot:gene1832-6247_t